MIRALAAVLALAVAGCGGAAVALPDDPVARASHCSAAKALELRQGQSGEVGVSFGHFAQIVHFAMISAARADGEVDLRQVMTVSQDAPITMQELQGRNWRSLIEPCAQAFPETRRAAGELPPDSFESGMMCFGLADFLSRTAADHPREGEAAAALADRALAAATPVLSQRAAGNEDVLRISDRYMARAFLAGTPASVLGQCARRFPIRRG